MNKTEKYLSVGILAALCAAVVGEEILCFIRAYSELWYTILVPGLVVVALALIAYFKKCRWLNVIASAIVVVGCALLVGFPSYVMYLALILGIASLVAEIIELVLYVVQKRKTEN